MEKHNEFQTYAAGYLGKAVLMNRKTGEIEPVTNEALSLPITELYKKFILDLKPIWMMPDEFFIAVFKTVFPVEYNRLAKEDLIDCFTIRRVSTESLFEVGHFRTPLSFNIDLNSGNLFPFQNDEEYEITKTQIQDYIELLVNNHVCVPHINHSLMEMKHMKWVQLRQTPDPISVSLTLNFMAEMSGGSIDLQKEKKDQIERFIVGEKEYTTDEPKLPSRFEPIPSLTQVINTHDDQKKSPSFRIYDIEGLNNGTFRIDDLHKQYARMIGPDHLLTDTNLGQCLFCLSDNQFYLEVGNMDGGAPKLRRTFPMYYFAINSIGG